MSAGRVSDPVKAALSGSHVKAPGSAGGYLHCLSMMPDTFEPDAICCL